MYPVIFVTPVSKLTVSTKSTTGECTDPCSGIDNCVTIVDSCQISPERSKKIASVTTSLNYKFAADVFCDHSMPLDNWKNIFHVTAGENSGSAGDRTFALWRNQIDNRLYFAVNNPYWGDGSHYIDHIDCVDGSWNTYSVTVNEVGFRGYLKYVASINDEAVADGSYHSKFAFTTGDLQVFVSDTWYDAATAFSVRNFYYQILTSPKLSQASTSTSTITTTTSTIFIP